jgi:hypothetical protein
MGQAGRSVRGVGAVALGLAVAVAGLTPPAFAAGRGIPPPPGADGPRLPAPLIKPGSAFGAAAIAGRIGSVTLTPADPGVVRYRYTFDAGADPRTVPAGPDGSATLEWTPESPGRHTLTAVGIDRDGTVSATRRSTVTVNDPAVTVTASWPASGTSLGSGVPGSFLFSGDLLDATTEYLWHVDDGPVATTPRDPGHRVTEVPFTPGAPGPSTLAVQRRFRDGTLSPVTEYHFDVGTEPYVMADPVRTTPHRATTLVFGGGMPGVASFDYQITGYPDGVVDGDGTVLVDGSGSAQVTFTPPSAETYQVIVTGHTANGTPTDTTTIWLRPS